uniref:Vicilin-like seed storage protein At2g18540 n=1 Tax=Macrostomum lignano TaxID=282301 RepID=A0A1I8GLH8_9PLAT
EEKKKRMAKMQEEMKEYEEMRKEEREKLEAEISDLRAKREQRKQERAEEEKRLAELRAIEEQKRRAEEEERQRRKREEEARRQEEREKKKREAEERSKSQSQRNFTISKKSGSETGPTGQDEAKQGKSKEQLEAEKKAALEQRVQPLNIADLGSRNCKRRPKSCSTRSTRLRATNKGRLGAARSAPKIIMYSQYERVKDRRDFGERQELFKGPIYGVEYERIPPSSKVIITEQGPRVVGEIGENDNDQGHNQQEGDEPVATEE